MKRLLLVLVLMSCLQTLAQAQYEYKFKDVVRNAATEPKDQGTTGTCWCFGTTSFIESEIIRKGGPALDLSEMFTVRYNYLTRTFDDYIRKGKGRVSQGSLPQMVINEMKANGCVPESVYPGKGPDSLHNHKLLFSLISQKAKDAVKAKEGYPRAEYEEILDGCLGKVPETFVFEGREYTPKTFFKSLKIDTDEYVMLTSFTHHPFYKPFDVEVIDNWNHQQMYNLPLDEFMEVIDHALRKGYTVAWDGDITNPGYDQAKCISLNTAEDICGMPSFKARCKELKVTQENRQHRFETFQFTDDHIEHVVGIAEDQEGVKYYITKNSWKTSIYTSGYHNMSEEYVKAYTVCVMVNVNSIPKSIRRKLSL